MTAPKFTGLAGEIEKAYTLLDQSNQPVSEILAKTNEISGLKQRLGKVASFDATFSLIVKMVRQKRLPFIGGQRIG